MNDIAFEDLTEEFGKSYKLFLIGKGYSASNMNHNLCWLQRLVYIAVDRGLLKFNPLEDVGYEKTGSPKRRHISRNDLLLIMETPMEDKALELARRMFVFSSLTGLAYVDLRNLYPHHIGMTADCRKYIREKRAKTNNEAFIPLHPIAEQIMSLYNTADDIWMTMQEIADMYNVFGCYVRKAVKAIFKDGTLKEQGVRRHVRKNDRISYDVYSLELVIAVAFRIDSIESRAFREFIMQSVIGRQTSRTKLVCIFTENAMA